ncbi:golgi 4-transmembrane spanning transporter [Trichuris suis]|nr:golgi 4-transmembrane spanning transporter [Trichuris suis]
MRLGSHNRHFANDPRFRCCGCCHVQTGAIFLGMYNIVLHSFAICFLTFGALDPDLFFGIKNSDSPVVAVINESVGSSELKVQSLHEMIPELPTPVPQESSWNSLDKGNFVIARDQLIAMARRRLQTGDANLAIALLFGLLFITGMMIYGVVKIRPLYLIPFFCFQIFDFILSCLTAVGHYVWMPNVDDIIQQNPNLPFRDHLTDVNSQMMAFCFLLLYIVVLMVKIYFIGIIWSCYQYLQAVCAAKMSYKERKVDVDSVRIFTPSDCEFTMKAPPAYKEPPPPPYGGV